MSEQNGVVRIKRAGKVKFAFGDGPEFEVDVVAVYDEWWQIDATFRDADGKMKPDQGVSYSMSRLSFVTNIVKAANGGVDPQLTHAEASIFMAKVTEEVMSLRPLWDVKLPGAPSSPESTVVRWEQ